MIPGEVMGVILGAELPCFVYDGAAIRERAAAAASLVDRYFFPIKVCPEDGVVRAVLSTGCGLDLCSEGDADIAVRVGCPGERWKYTAAHAGEALMRRLCGAGAMFDADSVEQGLRWGHCGGKACGLRITAKRPKALYGAKFGISVEGIAEAVRHLAGAGVRVEGLHLHDQHTNLSPGEFRGTLAESFAGAGGDVLRGCRYVNIGGSWPMRHGIASSVEELRPALE